ncbi:MAG: GntR family transcriptional regulator [Proteobacteria bacterium]|nr:GntR family transcriptional regulator [Pseudomonadota bacterium]MBS0568564.1 GntR family transcriptional regulator [Pseudomonadota bacterium]
MSPSNGRSKSRYIELSEILRARIKSGEYALGTLMPTELELCEAFDVSRHTARSALARLLAAGLVNRRPGAGTRVIAQHEAIRYEHEIDTVESLMQYGNTTRLRVITSRRETADAELAKQMEIAPGKDYLFIVSLRAEEKDGKPIAYTEMYAPVRRGLPTRRLLDLSTTARAVASYLDPAGLSCVEQHFDAAVFSREQAKLTGVAYKDAAMRVRRCYRDAGNRILMLAISLHPAGEFSYSMTLSRNRG